MRLLHTADWHLGRIFHGIHLTDDQAHLLEQFIQMARDTKPDAILITGDIYDRAVPPPEAVRLLDETLTRLCLDVGSPIIIIAGNHDSPERLGFGSRIMAERKLFIAGYPVHDPMRVQLQDKWGPVDLFPIPYAEPALVRERLKTSEAIDQASSLKAIMDRIRMARCAGTRTILLGHAFIQGCQASDSERPLSVGGAEAVETSLFDGFDLVALGHLHRSQSVNGGRIQYAGSLMKYSFGEADLGKSVSLVEMDGASGIAIQKLPLVPRRDLRIIEGTFADLLCSDPDDPKREDYLMARLLDRDPVFDVMGRLQAVYPNLLHIERAQIPGVEGRTDAHADFRKRTEVDLFSSFVQDITQKEWDEDQRLRFEAVVSELRREDREAIA